MICEVSRPCLLLEQASMCLGLQNGHLSCVESMLVSVFQIGKQASKCLFPSFQALYLQHKAERRIGNMFSSYAELECYYSISLDMLPGKTT